MKRILSALSNKSSIMSNSMMNDIETAIITEFGSSDPGYGNAYISTDGTFIQLYPSIDVHEDLCYWVEDNFGTKIDQPDEEWAIREFSWIRVRNDPRSSTIELAGSKPTANQMYAIEDWLNYVEESRGATQLHLGVCEDTEAVSFNFGEDSFTEDVIKSIKRYYSTHRLYASSIMSGEVFDNTSTGMSYYDSFLNAKDLAYMESAKNRTGHIERMSPTEYYEACANDIFDNTSVDKLMKQRNNEYTHEYVADMKRGDTFPLCMLNYADKSQEGLHRMMAAGDAFGWDVKYPVLVIEVLDEERERRYKLREDARDFERYDFKECVEDAASDLSDWDSPAPDDLLEQLSAKIVEIAKSQHNCNITVECEVKDIEGHDAIDVDLLSYETLELGDIYDKPRVWIEDMFDVGSEETDTEVDTDDFDIADFFFLDK